MRNKLTDEWRANEERENFYYKTITYNGVIVVSLFKNENKNEVMLTVCDQTLF